MFGQNQDYSENIDRLELDIIKALQGGCNDRELRTNDPVKRIIENMCGARISHPFRAILLGSVNDPQV